MGIMLKAGFSFAPKRIEIPNQQNVRPVRIINITLRAIRSCGTAFKETWLIKGSARLAIPAKIDAQPRKREEDGFGFRFSFLNTNIKREEMTVATIIRQSLKIII